MELEVWRFRTRRDISGIHHMQGKRLTQTLKAGRGGRVDSQSAYCAGGIKIKSWHPTSDTCM